MHPVSYVGRSPVFILPATYGALAVIRAPSWGGCIALALAGGRSILRGKRGAAHPGGGAKLSMNDRRTGEASMFALDPRLAQDTL
ncbi:hypothetical protein, partial [Pseudomonas aeruginosa]|uniref:hypothetical protein n=1 Tax=Pseudomonas aeruginosa TaxID=287 RepID=UPI001C405637